MLKRNSNIYNTNHIQISMDTHHFNPSSYFVKRLFRGLWKTHRVEKRRYMISCIYIKIIQLFQNTFITKNCFDSYNIIEKGKG